LELDILKIDLDMKRKRDAINHLKKRFAYFHDIGFYNMNDKGVGSIGSILLVKKTTYGCKIHFGNKFKSPEWIVLFQLLLGSDWMKECNTLINHFKFRMEYSNRLFDVKRYKNGKIKSAKHIDITNDIMSYVLSSKRKRLHN